VVVVVVVVVVMVVMAVVVLMVVVKTLNLKKWSMVYAWSKNFKLSCDLNVTSLNMEFPTNFVK
jgi:hypothetical protein